MKLSRFVFVSLCLLTPFAQAQLIERPNKEGAKPLKFGLTAQSDDIAVSPDDQWVVVNDQEQIFILDTTTWNAEDPQPADLKDRTEGFDFLPNSNSLFAQQADGFITRILADDPLTDLLETDVVAATGTGADRLVIDTEADGQLFLLNPNTKKLFRYNIQSQTIDASADVNIQDVTTLNSLTYLALPTTNQNGGTEDRLLITTNNSRVVVYSENLDFVATVLLAGTNLDCPSNGDPDSHVLPASAIHPDRNFAFVVNSTDNVVHVIDTLTLTEVDTNNQQGGINPICLHQIGPNAIDQDINSNLRDIVVTRVKDPQNAARAFVTGDKGLAILNATVGEFGVVDAADSDGNDPEEIEPITLSVSPKLVDASSIEDGYLYTANTDNSISVVSDNPFVTIASANPASVTQAAPEFDLTFQVDELCDGCKYRVRANGDLNESGALLLEAAYTNANAVNTDLTTAKISITNPAFAANTFIEGANQIFIFSDDAAGNVGRDSVIVTVDRPPPGVEIFDVSFGNAKGFVTIGRVDQDDIKQYNIYVVPAEDQTNPVCPGTIDFAAIPTPTFTVPQPESGDKIKITIPNLTNGTAYCVAIQVEDNGGNKSAAITDVEEPIIPEVTVGITGASGETGCQLSAGSTKFGFAGLTFLPLLFLGIFRAVQDRRKGFLISFFSKAKKLILILLFSAAALLSFSSSKALAYEVTDQKWTLQFQGGFFLPTNHEVDEFLGKCCNGMYNLSFGRIWESQYEVNLGVGLMSQNAFARGITTDRESGEKFNFTVVPMTTSFIYHFDRVENQLLVPYVNVGLDYMFFRENLQGDVTKGFKFGYHAALGLQILMEFFDDSADALEEYGINDTYLTFEGRWQQIDNFGGNGLSFTGATFSAGLLFEF